MHPFGGTPICPRCSKAVYLAEQVMGPGRKLYHKPCLACTSCNKRLDSFTLLEHDQLPYCKACHLKNFGTRDLRHANLPNAPPPGENTALPSPPSSPARGASFPPQALLRPMSTGTTSSSSNGSTSPIPRLRPNRTLATSPISPSFPRGSSPNSSAFQTNGNGVGEAKSETSTPTYTSSPMDEEKAGGQESSPALATSSIPEEDETEEEAAEARDTISEPASSSLSTTSYPSHTGRPGIGTIPRTIPLYLNGTNGGGMYKHHTSQSLGSITVPSSLTSSSSPSSSSPTSASFNRSKEAEDAVDDHISRSFPGPGSPMGMGMGVGSVRSASPARMSPLTQTATGTRYGIALAGGVNVHSTGTGGSPRKWGGGTPTCPKCNKSVYFAEQVKAVGKTFHKNCLRCTECNTSLDSTRLRDHDGDPYCAKCYGKLYGPAGSGYALLGKAGG
ncbi:hypothetical protein CVT26_010048 [Gymnopilus dilepis]|uniref:LIM zinc-binding domain-containing protein n=1 Tax=Gymnopilus dilepis TaxID=231916 RepID=A0A409VWL7_9AGAR|nr:hypothetical protein CVT26_010048 [Gymnopilus dilepis]